MRSPYSTWYTVEGLRAAVIYLEGVAAGTPLADVLFLIGAAICFKLIDKAFDVGRLQCVMDATGVEDCWNCSLGTVLNASGMVSLSQVSYVDDLAAPGRATVQRVLAEIAEKVAIVYMILFRFAQCLLRFFPYSFYLCRFILLVLLCGP